MHVDSHYEYIFSIKHYFCSKIVRDPTAWFLQKSRELTDETLYRVEVYVGKILNAKVGLYISAYGVKKQSTSGYFFFN